MRFIGLSIIMVSLVARTAQAGNDDVLLLGSQAVLTGGAVTAIVSDGASAWYNPAGLGHSSRYRLDVTGSVYGLNIYNVKPLLVLPNGSSADAKFADWILVPCVLSFARELNDDVVIALGMFIPRTNDFELHAPVTTDLGQAFGASLATMLNEYNYTLTMAVRLGPKLRLGATLAGVYLSRRDFVQVAGGTPGVPGEGFYSGSSFTAQSDYGVRLTLGMQWEPRPNWALGVSLQSPVFTGWSSVSRTVAQGAANPDGVPSSFTLDGRQGNVAVWDLTTPARLRAGVSYQLGATRLLLDGDVSMPFSAPEELPDTFSDRDWVGNARVGLLHAVSPGLTAGAGVFTDLSGRKQFKTQFAGVALGVELKTDHLVDEKTRDLTFSTTFGGRYAFGWGDLPGVEIVREGDGFVQQSIGAPVTVHELAFNLGGGVDF